MRTKNDTPRIVVVRPPPAFGIYSHRVTHPHRVPIGPDINYITIVLSAESLRSLIAIRHGRCGLNADPFLPSSHLFIKATRHPGRLPCIRDCFASHDVPHLLCRWPHSLHYAKTLSPTHLILLPSNLLLRANRDRLMHPPSSPYSTLAIRLISYS